ncbi:MAG: peptidoglycan editing factor PgeF [bacterium]
MKIDIEAMPGEGGALLWPAPAGVPSCFKVVFATRVAVATEGPGFVNYGFDGIPGAAEARRNLCRLTGLNFDKLTVGRQKHTATAAVVDESLAGTGRDAPNESLAATDALITGLRGVPLGVTTADCVPVLLADPTAKAAAAVHAGWRGTVAGIVANTIEGMKRNFGSAPQNISAFLGPAIGPCCYEVGDDLLDQLPNGDMIFVEKREGRNYLNLYSWNAARLCDEGLDPKNIYVSEICTCCRPDLFFTYRGDKNCRGLNFSMIARLG